MLLVMEPTGNIRCLYTEAINLAALGSLTIRRGSHLEPTAAGTWLCDLAPVSGPMLGPFDCRSEALAAETAWLEAQWLTPGE